MGLGAVVDDHKVLVDVNVEVEGALVEVAHALQADVAVLLLEANESRPQSR